MFTKFREEFLENSKTILKNSTALYKLDIDKDILWDTYYNNIPTEYNHIHITNHKYDCSACRHFIKQYGNICCIKDSKIKTLWSFNTSNPVFKNSIEKLSKLLESASIKEVFVIENSSDKTYRIGIDNNKKLLDNGHIDTYKHFYLDIPTKFQVSNKNEYVGNINIEKQVLKDSLELITEEAIKTVLNLTKKRELYRSDLQKEKLLTKLLKLKLLYMNDKTEMFLWENVVKNSHEFNKIKNTSMGVLLTDLSQGMDLNDAVDKYEFIVGDGYKRPQPIFDRKMVDFFKNDIINKGYNISFMERTFANTSDIPTKELIYINDEDDIVLRKDIFDKLNDNTVEKKQTFHNLKQISASEFIKNVIPTAKKIEIYSEQKLKHNLVNLVKPVNNCVENIFKWNNNISWTYNNNLAAPANIKEIVMSLGGNIEAILRCSIMWNHEKEYNDTDFDLHCYTPNNEVIYFGNLSDSLGGELDIDIRYPKKRIPAVENIYFKNNSNISNGRYKFYVNVYDKRCEYSNIKVNLKAGKEEYNFYINESVSSGKNIDIAYVICNKDENLFKVTPILKELKSNILDEEYEIKNNTFITVNAICTSPNYWGDNAVGNKHYMFLSNQIKKKNSLDTGIFYNEFLNWDFNSHKRIIEYLTLNNEVNYTNQQACGFGFPETKTNNVIFKVNNILYDVLF